MEPFIANVPIRKISYQNVIDTDDLLAVEEPLEIQLLCGNADNRIQKSISVTMRTPGHDEELAAGFLFTEGIIRSNQEILFIKKDAFDQNRILVGLQENVKPQYTKNGKKFLYYFQLRSVW